MPRYRATLAYDGTAYMGFQRQLTSPTIQLSIETAIQQVTGQAVTLMGAGRTDAGVHASGQVIAFDVDWKHPDEALLRAINAHLPPDIALQSICQHEGFHPRYDALSRRYVYTVINTPNRHPLYHQSAWHVRGDISLMAMQTVAEMLIGVHDFRAFGQDPQGGDSTIREVFISEWTSTPIPDGALLRYTVEANAFLYHMVRRMVGAQVLVGRGMLSPEAFLGIFQDGAMEKIKQIAPPHGLVLEKVRYPEDND
jgi:tRNA pseudouridine38-40 synthase